MKRLIKISKILQLFSFKFLHKTFRWNLKDLIKAITGALIYALAINLFIVPNSLYNGGILGISQLLRTIITTTFNLDLAIDIAGIINFIINIPLLFIAYKVISKTFFGRTVVCVIFTTIFLTVIPIPEKALIDDLLTNVLIGGILCGLGSGKLLSSHGSGGGTDIIGIALSMKNRNLSVGKIGGTINLFIYAICGILYGIPTMIYSIIYAVIGSLVVDNTHEQNVVSYVMIFTKKMPDTITEFIQKELNRDATVWEGTGAYNKTKTYICYSALSKYEVQKLERNIKHLDKDAFMIKNEGVGVDGNFQKYLVN